MRNSSKHWRHLPVVSVDTHNTTLEDFQRRKEENLGELMRFCDELLADLAECNPQLARMLRVVRDKEQSCAPEWVFRYCIRILLMLERQKQADEWAEKFNTIHALNPRDPQ